MLSQIIQRSWYQPVSFITILLLPFSLLFCILVFLRALLYRVGLLRQTHLNVPVIIVGNITVGGAGKTPLVIALVEHLKSKGYKPGVVSRGYGGNSGQWPQNVTPTSSPEAVGDEAVLIAGRTQSPVCVGPDRVSAAHQLLEQSDCDVIISDDGLQHLSLARDIEIVVIDGERRLGNGFCLPAGPLRELPARLNRVDMIVSNGTEYSGEFEMQLTAAEFVKLDKSADVLTPDELVNCKVHAVAGIGNNERFFNTLEKMGIFPERHGFADHHAYQDNELQFNDELPVLMTEKDAVKCKAFSLDKAWYLKVHAKLGDDFYQQLDSLLQSLRN